LRGARAAHGRVPDAWAAAAVPGARAAGRRGCARPRRGRRRCARPCGTPGLRTAVRDARVRAAACGMPGPPRQRGALGLRSAVRGAGAARDRAGLRVS